MDERRKVLIVDDDANILNALELFVDLWGYIPISAAGPGEAIRIFQSDEEIQLVVTDHGMRPIGGIELVAILRQTGRRFEAILFTGGRQDALVESAASAVGIRKVLHKPYTERIEPELQAAVAALVRP